MLGYYNYTVILTYIGMITGFFGIVYAFDGDPWKANICLILAGLCDMFDGTIAATKERTIQEKHFGIQIDSLSDLICFGVLPAAIAYNLNKQTSFALFVCAFYLLCALIRLAYFNVDEQERQKNATGAREIYYGMPVTMAAIFLPSLYGMESLFSRGNPIAFIGMLLLMAFLFLIPFSVKKPKLIGKICVILCGVVEVILMIAACLDV